MRQSTKPGAGLRNAAVKVEFDTNGPPILNQAAASALLRILIAATERQACAESTSIDHLEVPSDL